MILKPSELAAIGSVAVESTNCEEFVESLIWQLLGIEEEQGKFVTKGVQMNSRLELLLNLAKERLAGKTEMIAKITDIKSRMVTANTDRNTLIHGTWKPPTNNMLAFILKGRDKYGPATAFKRALHSEPANFSAEHARSAAVRIARLNDELMQFAVDHWDDFLAPSLKKSGEQPQHDSQT